LEDFTITQILADNLGFIDQFMDMFKTTF